MSPFSKMGFRRYLQFLSAFSRLVLILSGFTGSSFPDDVRGVLHEEAEVGG